MKFSESECASARWGDAACLNWGDWTVLAEHAEVDYQGSCKAILRSPNEPHTFVLVEWTYGSCSGCDGYEDLAYGDYSPGGAERGLRKVAAALLAESSSFADAAAVMRYLAQVDPKPGSYAFERDAGFTARARSALSEVSR